MKVVLPHYSIQLCQSGIEDLYRAIDTVTKFWVRHRPDEVETQRDWVEQEAFLLLENLARDLRDSDRERASEGVQ